jgi:hypothetical protein
MKSVPSCSNYLSMTGSTTWGPSLRHMSLLAGSFLSKPLPSLSLVLEMESRASYILDKHPTTETHPQLHVCCLFSLCLIL